MKLATKTILALMLPLLWAFPAQAQTEADSVTVTFQVDATDLIAACRLGGETAFYLEVRGPMNDWSGGEKWRLSDPDEDKVYTLTAKLNKSVNEYKFFHSGIEWEDGSNHPLTLTEDLTLPVATFNKAFTSACGSVQMCVDFLFQVNMAAQVFAGNFSEENNLVVVAGDINGWSTTADTLVADITQPGVYSKWVRDTVGVPGVMNHKFVLGTLGAAPAGWEAFNGNRVLNITGDETESEDGCLEVIQDPIPYFSNFTMEDLFQEPTTVYLEVDARPAFYFLADSSFVYTNADRTATTETFDKKIFINGPLMATTWATWGVDENMLGQMPDRMLVDDGTNGDAVAGDSVYTMKFDFETGDSRKSLFKLSAGGYDNENPSERDHNVVFPAEANGRVRVVFGAARSVDGSYLPTNIVFYDPYIEISEDGQSVMVVRRTETSSEKDPIAAALKLANYPNPAHGKTTFTYTLDKAQQVRLRVFDLMGRLVSTVVDEVQSAGTYELPFDVKGLAAGTYVYQLEAQKVVSRTMIVVK